MLLDTGGGQQQQIVEVDAAGAPLGLLVAGVDRGYLGAGQRWLAAGSDRSGGVVLRPDQPRFRPLDLPGKIAQFGAAAAAPGPAGRLGD